MKFDSLIIASISLIFLTLLKCAQGLIESNGLCTLFTFVPFTIPSETGPVQTETFTDNGTYQNDLTNQGFSHMSTALMAMDHFNNRNDTVVKELTTLTNGCNVQFDTNLSQFFDTGSLEHFASKQVWQSDVTPCAMAGPFNDIPAIDLSVVALSAEIPLVVARAFNGRITSNDLSPFTTQVFPSLHASSVNMMEYLLYKERSQFIGVLYSLTETGIQRRESLAIELNKYTDNWFSSAYDVSKLGQETSSTTTSDPFLAAMQRIKNTGYRTIVVAMEFANFELPRLANAAEQLGMNNGDYFWIWFGVFEPSHVYDEDENVIKLLSGSSLVLPFSQAYLDLNNSFIQAYITQGKPEVDRLNAANPIQPGQVGYVFAEDNFFQEVNLEYASDFLYDSVMAAGIGACLADPATNGTISGTNHLNGIRGASFTGASGRVVFGEDGHPDRIGARIPSTVLWSEFNILPPLADGSSTNPFEITAADTPESERWIPLNVSFVYRDGTTVGPALRDPPDMNFLNNGLRALGLALMGVAILLSIACAVWVYVKRKHSVLRALQPPFLYIICFGAAVEASAIFTISWDESYGWSEESLSSSCMATPWLLATGFILIYSSLFTKMWRVNKVLQFSRRRIKMKHVAAPMIALVTAALVVLTVWTAVDPLRWNRTTVDDMTGASIGRCTSDYFGAFIIPLIFLMLLPTVATAFMAWKTLDVDEAYVESKWVFSMIVVQLEVAIVAVPVIFILKDVSTNGRYLGYMLLLWVFPMSTLLLIFWPKYVSYRRVVRGIDASAQPIRGQRKGVVVSGLPPQGGPKPTVSSTGAASNASRDVNPAHEAPSVLEPAAENPSPTGQQFNGHQP